MKLQTNSEEKPKNLGVSDTLIRAEALSVILEEHGMTDTSSQGVVLTKPLVTAVKKCVGGRFAAVRLYLANLIAVTPRSRGTLFRAAVRMAALRREFQVGRCPVVSPDFTCSHWAGAYILSAENYYDEDRRKYRLGVQFLIVTGEYSGVLLQGRYPRGFAGVMRYEIGASLRGSAAKLEDAQHHSLLNLCQCAVFLEQRKSVSAVKISATPTMVAANKRLVRLRFRELSDCPFGAPFNCVACSATTADCPRAIFPSQ